MLRFSFNHSLKVSIKMDKFFAVIVCSCAHLEETTQLKVFDVTDKKKDTFAQCLSTQNFHHLPEE
jgi:hypothetical protein